MITFPPIYSYHDSYRSGEPEEEIRANWNYAIKDLISNSGNYKLQQNDTAIGDKTITEISES